MNKIHRTAAVASAAVATARWELAPVQGAAETATIAVTIAAVDTRGAHPAVSLAAALAAVALLSGADRLRVRRFIRQNANQQVDAQLLGLCQSAACAASVTLQGVIALPGARTASWTAGWRGGWLAVDPALPPAVLANYVAHEIGHGKHRHVARKLVAATIAVAGQAAVQAAIGGWTGLTAGLAVAAVREIVLAAQQRAHERQADKHAYRHAGRDAFLAAVAFNAGQPPRRRFRRLLASHPTWAWRLVAASHP